MQLGLVARESCHTQVMASPKTLGQVLLVPSFGMTLGYSNSETVPKTKVSWAVAHSLIHQVFPVGLLCARNCTSYRG